MDVAGKNVCLGGEKYPSERYIVLVGNRGAGKSTVGNLILGNEEFDLRRTTQCVRRQGVVAGRQVTVVEAPGWWRNYPLEETPRLTQNQMELSVSMCTPGPDVFLLVIHLDSPFTETQRRTTEEHLSLFGERVWRHTIALFVSGDQLRDPSIEQQLREEKALACLVRKCGDRYHILNSRRKDDGRQITELLEKIDKMVMGNSGQHYEVSTKRLQLLEEERRKTADQMKDRMEKVEQQRMFLRTLKDDAFPHSELRIVLLGYRAAGKSSAGNTILGKKEFDLKRTARCVTRHGVAAERKVTLVEAPGWWRNCTLINTPRLVREEIEFSGWPGLHAVLIAVRVDYSFTESHRRALEEHLSLLSEGVWNHTIVLFTFGDWLGDTVIEQHIQSEGKDLQWLVEKCGNRYHVLNCKARGDYKQVTDLLEKVEEMFAGNSKCLHEIRNERKVELELRKRSNQGEITKRIKMVAKQREDHRALMDDTMHLPELRIVLLGYSTAGKSSAANTILGKKGTEFDLGRMAQCVKRQGEVAGRKVTVVEAPGWKKNCPLGNTSKWTTQEIELSVSVCFPGPHAVLLVTNVDTAFTDTTKEVVKQHLELLSKQIWNHTMVLFTGADLLGDVAIEEHIESEGVALKWLVEKCGNRYHVLNNEDTEDDTQVKTLLEKIEEMVVGNNSQHFTPHKKLFNESAKTKIEKRAKEREMKVKKQRENHRLHMGDVHHLSNVRLVLLGRMGAGKISAGNTILGKEAFDLKSTTQCVRREGEVAGRHITVVKAPGWWRKDQAEKTSEMAKQIESSLSQCAPGPHAILLVIRVDTAFTETKRGVVQQYLQHLKIPNVWKHILILFTCGDWLGGATIEQHIESEGDKLKQLVDKCGNRYHVFNNKWRGDNVQVKELLEKIEEMVAGNHGKLLCLEEMVVTQEVQQLSLSKRAGSYQLLPPNLSAENRSETSSFGGSQASLGSDISFSSLTSRSRTSSISSGYESDRSDTGSMKGFPERFTKFLTNLAAVSEEQERHQHKQKDHHARRRKRTITEPTEEENPSEHGAALPNQCQRISTRSEPTLFQSQV